MENSLKNIFGVSGALWPPPNAPSLQDTAAAVKFAEKWGVGAWFAAQFQFVGGRPAERQASAGILTAPRGVVYHPGCTG